MYRPNRIGPCPIIDIEEAPFDISATLITDSSDAAMPEIKGIIKSSTANDDLNGINFHVDDKTLNSSTNDYQSTAYGCLINGETFDEEKQFISVSGLLTLTMQGQAIQSIFPIIGRLDGDAPADPTTTAAVISQWTQLPCSLEYMIHTSGTWTHLQASVNIQTLIGNIQGNTPIMSMKPIFIGWVHTYILGSTISVSALGNIYAHKYISDLNTVDPSRS